MFRPLIVTSCVCAASAFFNGASLLPAHSTSARLASHKPLRMQLESAAKPVDIFKDMDGEGQDMKTSAFLKESEIKHGRLAMLAAVGWPVSEVVHPFFAETLNLPSILNEAGQVPSVLNGGLEKIIAVPGGFLFVLFTLGRVYTLETSALRPRNNFVSKDPKERFPYDLGFDPLGFYAKATPSQRETMALKELNNGRLAMIAMALYPCIEFASKQPLFQITQDLSE
jgi:hypothetical protein